MTKYLWNWLLDLKKKKSNPESDILVNYFGKNHEIQIVSFHIENVKKGSYNRG